MVQFVAIILITQQSGVYENWISTHYSWQKYFQQTSTNSKNDACTQYPIAIMENKGSVIGIPSHM